MLVTILLVLAGCALLYYGAEWLVEGAASLALSLGVSRLIVGLTVVAYGTSMPELGVSVEAALKGNDSVAIGNVVGSNICTIGLVLGVPALITTLPVSRNTVRLHAPIMILGCALLAFFLWDNVLSRMEGGILLGGLVAYTILGFRLERQSKDAGFVDEIPETTGKISKDVGLILGGIAGVLVGGHFLLEGAVDLAERIGVSDAVIGLTVVALGTSLPDLTASAMAALKKHGEIAVGNALGSVMFNTYMVISAASMTGPLNGDEFNRLDLYVMVGIAALALPMMLAGMKVRRWQGAVFVVIYLCYVILRWPTGAA